MQRNLKVSVITIVFNLEAEIEKTIQSVINQTFQNVEFIVVDGGSSDGTLHIIEKYKNRINTFITGPDKGLFDAMNKGLTCVSGDYVIFMNGGDRFYSHETLATVVKELDDIGDDSLPGLIYGHAMEESKDGRTLFLKRSRSPKVKWWGMFTHHQAMMYNMSVIRKYGIRYDLKVKIGSDYKFTLEFLNHTGKTFAMNEPLCVFRQGGISHKRWKTALKEQWWIRRRILKHTVALTSLIYFLQWIVTMIRKYFTPVYNFLRFSR